MAPIPYHENDNDNDNDTDPCRPSRAIIRNLQRDKELLEEKLRKICDASPDERESVIRSVGVIPQQHDSGTPTTADVGSPLCPPEERSSRVGPTSSDEEESEAEIDNFVSVDESGTVAVYGLTSGLHAPSRRTYLKSTLKTDTISHQLIASALLQRQKEYYMSSCDFDGVPGELALHLLDLHWNRQHHSFLLTYRPVIMRDLAAGGGQHCSKILLNAIFACVSKYSNRLELRSDPSDPTTAGVHFLRRFKELLPLEMETSSIPLVVALLLVGSTLVSSGKTSTGWLYSGMAFRMVYDLGLHLDCRDSVERGQMTVEDMEIRRRVFWGAFICDKLQSLYLGRPASIQLADAHVPLEFLDTSEEEEVWSPYRDSIEECQNPSSPKASQFSAPIHSVSTFKQLCLLSRIMTCVINKFYVIGATRKVSSKHKQHLLTIDADLQKWDAELPSHLRFEVAAASPCAPPNILTLQSLYNCLVILLHRPFIADGHLRNSAGPTLTASSWQKCTAAAQRIAFLVSAYRTHLTLRRAPYQISYAVYVASTIHVRNAAQGNRESRDLLNFCLLCLRELSTPNVGTAIPERIIRHLMRTMGVVEEEYQSMGGKNILGYANLDALHQQTVPSPWSQFDLDAIVRSFPEPAVPVQQSIAPNIPQPALQLLPVWNEDVLFGLMDCEFSGDNVPGGQCA